MSLPRRTAWRFALGLGLLALGAVSGYALGRRSASRPEEAPSPPWAPLSSDCDVPVARVRAVAIRRGTLEEDVELYGTVVPKPASVYVHAVPYEVIAERLRVSEGERVEAKAPLLDIRRSPASTAAFENARRSVAEAQAHLKQVTARQKDGMATSDELLRARGEKHRAETALEAMRQAGQDVERRSVRARAAGVVLRVRVRAGSIVPAGTALVEIAAGASRQVQLLAEAEDAPAIRPGAVVRIWAVEAANLSPLTGHVTLVARQVDPVTRLVKVLAAVEAGDRFLVNQYVRARTVLRSRKGVIVPRAALVPSGSRFGVFTISSGRAVRHEVEVGMESAEEMLVRGKGLEPGQPVVTVGAPQLEDGVRVQVLP